MTENETEHKPDTPLVEATAAEVKRLFGDFLNRAGYGNERILIVRHGKQVAGLVGISDLKRLRSLDAA